MRRQILMLLMCTIGVCAQVPPLPEAVPISKVFQIKYGDVNRIAGLINNMGASARADNDMHVIAVRGSKETVAAIEEALKQLDVPPAPQKDIEITGYVIVASSEPAAQPEPADLAAPLKQMHALLPYKSYRVVDTIVLRGRDGQGAHTQGMLAATGTGSKPQYTLDYSQASVTAQGGNMIRLDRLSFGVKIGGNSLAMNTNLDVHEGQKVVVGKTSVNGMEEAIILILSAKVID